MSLLWSWVYCTLLPQEKILMYNQLSRPLSQPETFVWILQNWPQINVKLDCTIFIVNPHQSSVSHVWLWAWGSCKELVKATQSLVFGLRIIVTDTNTYRHLLPYWTSLWAVYQLLLSAATCWRQHSLCFNTWVCFLQHSHIYLQENMVY